MKRIADVRQDKDNCTRRVYYYSQSGNVREQNEKWNSCFIIIHSN